MRVTGYHAEALALFWADIFDRLGHAWFSSGAYNLNLWGVRSPEQESNRFDDWICCASRDERGRWVVYSWPDTTDPGAYWLQNPGRVDGTAILVPGQYRGAWSIGLHRGSYEALVQRKPVQVWRDNNKDKTLDWGRSKAHKGLFGINIHKAGAKSSQVDRWSAGCQVFSQAAHFADLMALVRKSATTYGDAFTYALIEASAVEELCQGSKD